MAINAELMNAGKLAVMNAAAFMATVRSIMIC